MFRVLQLVTSVDVRLTNVITYTNLPLADCVKMEGQEKCLVCATQRYSRFRFSTFGGQLTALAFPVSHAAHGSILRFHMLRVIILWVIASSYARKEEQYPD